jgi:MOSC domain-containing protein YiiM
VATIKGRIKAISISRERGTRKSNVPAALLQTDFAENITTEGIDLLSLNMGDRLRLGLEAEVEVTQFGKECHTRCEIFEQVGDCVMPREGIFARVTRPGPVKPGDSIEVLNEDD